jgi:hypothetical protein
VGWRVEVDRRGKKLELLKKKPEAIEASLHHIVITIIIIIINIAISSSSFQD